MPAAGIIPASLAIRRPPLHSLSSCRAITGPDVFHPFSILLFPIATAGNLTSPAIIRMGGGPRTFPGGVSKWQWKRMQAKKAQQLLKARLCRERQIYEMRKRAELKASISELERPWEVVERAPLLFSVSADEQVKVLADRFQRPSGFDMWSERDGPQLFLSPDDLPSARFFPKGAVHSLKPYSSVSGKVPDVGGDSDDCDGKIRYNDWIARAAGGIGRGGRARRVLSDSFSSETIMLNPGKSGDGDKWEDPTSYSSDSELPVTESREEKEKVGLLNRHGRNHGSQESDVGTFTMNGDKMAAEICWANGSSSVSHLSDSKLALHDFRMEGHEMAVGVRRRGGRVSCGGNRVSYVSHSELPVTGSRVKGDKIARGLSQRHPDSRMDGVGQKMLNDNYQLGGGGSRGSRGGRGSRNGNRSYFRSNSALPVTGAGREGDMEGGNFGRRGDHGGNRVSQISKSKFGVVGLRMDDRGIDERFSGRGGRGGRRGRVGSRGSDLRYSDLIVKDDSSIDRAMAGDFGDHNGNHRSSRDPSISDSDHSVARWRTERDDIAGSFDTCRGRKKYAGNQRVETYGRFGRGGGHGGYRGSSESDSDLIIGRFRRESKIGMSSRFGRSGQDYKGTSRVPLRPTAELRLEGGSGGHGSRGRR